MKDQDHDDDQKVLGRYVPLVRFLAQQFPDTEFVLHDINRLDSSIVAIENKHISGRNVGGPATDLVLRIIQSREYTHRDFTPVYTSVSDNGQFLNSGTFYIKNKGRLIGFLCANTDLTALHGIAKAVDDLFASRGQREQNEHPEPEDKSHFSERLRHSVSDISVETTLAVIREKDLHPQHMTQEERLEVVAELQRRGTFLLKGSIPMVAKALKVSEASIYRYLRQLR